MHVKAKQIAFAGLLTAFSVILVVLSSVIESSSLFFIAAASFCIGIVIREFGLLSGVAFFVASVLVNFLAAPNKVYCFTFMAMSGYLLLREWLWEKIAEKEKIKNRKMYLWIGKYIIFNAMYLPILIGVPELVFSRMLEGKVSLVIALLGQPALYIFDMAYNFFQSEIWGKLRRKLRL